MANIYVCPGCGKKYSNLKDIASCVTNDANAAEQAEKISAARKQKAEAYEKEINILYAKLKEVLEKFNSVSDERKACASLSFTSNDFNISNNIKSLKDKYNINGRSELDRLINDVFGF